jgi:AcrR family transcriptional regulator
MMTKDEILLAAAQIFRAKGFHAASMQDIAQAVSLQKASLYYHVNSKQEILLELLDWALDVIIQEVGAVVDLNNNADIRFEKAVHAYLNTILQHLDLASVLILEHRSLEPGLREKHIPRRDRFEQLWRQLLIDGIEQGIFQCEDPSMAARAILGTLNWTITWYRPEGKLSPDDIANIYVNLFLQGLDKTAVYG